MVLQPITVCPRSLDPFDIVSSKILYSIFEKVTRYNGSGLLGLTVCVSRINIATAYWPQKAQLLQR